MSRPLRAERYARRVDIVDGAERSTNLASPTLAKIITDRLHYFDFEEAMAFYARFIEARPTNYDLALLGCNDRFFLLTGLLNRVDILKSYNPSWLYERAREIEAEPDGYLDLWSRYHYKTTFGTFGGTIQDILIDPEVRVCIFANTKDIAAPFAQQIKEEFETNERLKNIYSDVLWANPRKEAPAWTNSAFTVRRTGNYKECTVEAHGLINALPTGKHFPILNYDDVITERNVTNDEQVAKSVERTELSFPIGIGEKTRRRFYGTRYHFGDAYGQLIDRKIAIPRIYPATDDGTLNGKPVLMSPEEWEKVKRDMRSVVAAQMLQNPLAGKENTFETKWLRPFFLRPLIMNVYIMGDPSRGKSATSDRTAIAVIGIDSNNNKFLVDGYCHKMPLSERWAKLKELHRKWVNMPGAQLVKVGYERYGQQSDDEYFQEKMREEAERNDTFNRFDIVELNWTGDAGRESKKHRVERLEPDFRNGDFFVPGRIWYPLTVPEGGKLKSHTQARWYLVEGKDELHYRVEPGLELEERQAKGRGEGWRLFEPLMRRDEDGALYDVTRVFFEEYCRFPFSARDDFVDAMSRIYDMEPMPATPFEVVPALDYQDA